MEGDGLARPSTPIGNFRQAPSRSSSPYSDAFMAKIISRSKKVKRQLWLKLCLFCVLCMIDLILLASLQIQVIWLLQCILLRVYLFALIFSPSWAPNRLWVISYCALLMINLQFK
ncbi:hypothetical protein VPH35_065911 [Triticum aestivum]